MRLMHSCLPLASKRSVSPPITPPLNYCCSASSHTSLKSIASPPSFVLSRSAPSLGVCGIGGVVTADAATKFSFAAVDFRCLWNRVGVARGRRLSSMMHLCVYRHLKMGRCVLLSRFLPPKGFLGNSCRRQKGGPVSANPSLLVCLARDTAVGQR